MRSGISIILILLFFSIAKPDTLHVPDDFPTIQEAINAAANGDTVLVRSGQYAENIDFISKAITVTSEAGPSATVIDGMGLGSVVTFSNGEGLDSVLEGFTLRNGWGTFNPPPYQFGGGIYCYQASPTIRRNVITSCGTVPYGYGGGIYCYQSDAHIESNRIDSCSVSYHRGGGLACEFSAPIIFDNAFEHNTGEGGAIYSYQSSPSIRFNYIHLNGAKGSGGNGGGIYGYYSTLIIENNRIMKNGAYRGGGFYLENCKGSMANNLFIRNNSAPGATSVLGGAGILENSPLEITNNLFLNNESPGYMGTYGGALAILECDPMITGNTFVENTATLKGGAIYCKLASPVITNCIVWNNTSGNGSQIFAENSSPDITYCDVEGGWPGTGNINADPVFVNPAIDDYHLCFHSACRDSGTSMASGLPDHDFEGDFRIADDSADMGMDEFHAHLYLMGSNPSPGDPAAIRMLGRPDGITGVLWASLEKLDPSVPTMYGDWCLFLPPLVTLPLSPFPPAGFRLLTFTVPLTAPAPLDIHMQAFFSGQLAPCCTLRIVK